ncbi:hypothetical protein ACJX0J_012434, partial [Zea mays]
SIVSKMQHIIVPSILVPQTKHVHIPAGLDSRRELKVYNGIMLSILSNRLFHEPEHKRVGRDSELVT